MIETIALSKTYSNGDIDTTALAGINLKIQTGDMVAITGPSGCGKSTLLNILGMIDRPDSGAYLFEGTDIAGYNEQQRTRLRRNKVGFIFQSFNLVHELTVYENIELPLLYTGTDNAGRRQRVNAMLERMQLRHRSGHYPQQLSGGQQQRVAVARAIITNPGLLLADEPTGNLDSRHGDEVMQLLLELHEAGTTVVMVTHALQYAQLCRKVWRMLDGSIITEQAKASYA